MNEKEANELNIPYETTIFGIDHLDRAITDSEVIGFIKVLTKPGKDKILGVTIVSLHAGDLIAEYILAMKHSIGLNKILLFNFVFKYLGKYFILAVRVGATRKFTFFNVATEDKAAFSAVDV